MWCLGSVDISAQPNECTDKAEKAKITLGELVKTRKDTPVLLDFIDEALDQMAFLIKMLVIVPLLLAVGSGWNNHFDAPLGQQE